LFGKALFAREDDIAIGHAIPKYVITNIHNNIYIMQECNQHRDANTIEMFHWSINLAVSRGDFGLWPR
jgi:D-tyrosyl-tRNA(Tyr) deacylase